MDTDRTDRRIVLGIAIGLWVLGVLGLIGWAWSRHVEFAGPGSPVIPIGLIFAGFVALAFGRLRSQ